jgi:hypothetical protein
MSEMSRPSKKFRPQDKADIRPRLLPCTTLALALMTGAAEAQPGSFQPSGAAAMSCGAWTAARRENNPLSWMSEQWVLGFLSGVGYAASQGGLDPLRGVDDQAVWAWVDNYCRDHPLNPLVMAVAAFRVAHPH